MLRCHRHHTYEAYLIAGFEYQRRVDGYIKGWRQAAEYRSAIHCSVRVYKGDTVHCYGTGVFGIKAVLITGALRRPLVAQSLSYEILREPWCVDCILQAVESHNHPHIVAVCHSMQKMLFVMQWGSAFLLPGDLEEQKQHLEVAF